MGQFIPLAISLAAAGAQKAETDRVNREQDQQISLDLTRRGQKQQRADERVAQEVERQAASSADAERIARQDQYDTTLRQGRRRVLQGLDTDLGSQAFQGDVMRAQGDVLGDAAQQASLAARIDAPILQRTREAVGYGNLGTDLASIGREVAGQEFINQLRLRAIRRNPNVDFVAGVAQGASSNMGGGGGGIGGVTRQPIAGGGRLDVPNVPLQIAYGGGRLNG